MLYINLTGNIVIDSYSVFILIAVYFHSCRQKETESLQNKLFKIILLVAALSLVLDMLGRFDGRPGTIYPIINFWGNLLTSITYLIIPSLWLLYIHSQVTRCEKKTMRLAIYMTAINAVNAVIMLVSLSYGWFYYIDSQNIYHRGPLYWILVIILILFMMAAFIYIIINRSKIESKYYYTLLFFAVPPFFCIFLQVIFYGASLMLNSTVLSLLVVYINIQSRYMNIDHLTGVSNRKRLETFLKEKIAASTENHTFSAILIDMDNFKSINDNFGHDIGDEALTTFAQQLKSCLRSSDFVARYGGDEFYIILDTSARETLESTVSRIRRKIKKYNESGVKPYKLEFSMGYDIYSRSSGTKTDEFMKRLDMLMYENKRMAKEIIA